MWLERQCGEIPCRKSRRYALRRSVLACPRCGGRLRLIALIEQRAVVTRILAHLGLPTELPVPRPARPPPDEAPVHGPVGEDSTDVFAPAS